MDFPALLQVLTTVSVFLLLSHPAMAKEYNQGTHIAPEQRAKVDKTIAKARVQANVSGVDDGAGDIVSDGVTQTGCGKLAIGNVEAPKYGNKAIKVDRDIIITGDVINIATGCKKARE